MKQAMSCGYASKAARVGERLLDWHPNLVVERPKVLETTALGAAYLAGLGCGRFGSTGEIAQLWQRGVIVLPAGTDGVRFRPALTVSRAEIDLAIAAVRDVLAAVA